MQNQRLDVPTGSISQMVTFLQGFQGGITGFADEVNSGKIAETHLPLAVDAVTVALGQSGFTRDQVDAGQLQALLSGHSSKITRESSGNGRGMVSPVLKREVLNLLRGHSGIIDGALKQIRDRSAARQEELLERLPAGVDTESSGPSGLLVPGPSRVRLDTVDTFERAEKPDDYFKGIEVFARNLFRQVAMTSPDGNVFMSPYGVVSPLVLLRNGAVGATADAIDNLFHVLGTDMSKVNVWQRALSDALGEAAQDVIWHAAEMVVLNPRIQIRPELLQLIKMYFPDTDVRNAVSGIEDHVNGWVRKKTGGMIDRIMSPGEFSVEDVLHVLGALYFKGRWTHVFDEQDTAPDKFRTTHGEVTTPIMYQYDSFGSDYDRGTGMQLVRLPYGDGKFSMIAAVPKEVTTLSSFMEKYGDVLNRWPLLRLDDREDRRKLWMPKFRTSFDLDLVGALTAMGLGNIFDPAKAQLGGIFGGDDAGVYLRKFKQRAVVEVNEWGTEAAEITLGEATLGIPMNVKLDRPFLYMIVHERTGIPIFMGWLADPTKE